MEGSPPWTEIFMPLTGESLKTLATATTKTAELSELAQTVLHQMFQALDHVASDSIIHRDIKPDNILYEPRCKEWGRPYHFFLADFGLSQEMVKATTITGTEPFMAPEVVHRHRGFIQHLEQGPRGRISQFRVHGKVLGTSVVALPDSGADVCFISQSLARKLLLYPTPGTGRRIRVANNTYLRSSGSVEVSWQFPGELGTYPIVCWVLPTCGLNVDMILGRKFLKATNTSMRGPRVQKTYAWVPRSVSVKLLGEGKQRLWGYLNGDLVPALPDTGSDIMAMSKAYATKLGLRIDSNSKDIVEVEFPNGTTALTDGVVRNVPWTIGDHTSRWDFFVLDDLCVDVILSKDYVFDYDVFAEYENLLTDDETTDHLLDLYGVRLLRTFGPALEQLAEESIEDSKSARQILWIEGLGWVLTSRSDIARCI